MLKEVQFLVILYNFHREYFTMELEDDQLVLRDFPPGPLDDYRKQSKFDWKKLKFFFENPDLLKLKVRNIFFTNFHTKYHAGCLIVAYALLELVFF